MNVLTSVYLCACVESLVNDRCNMSCLVIDYTHMCDYYINYNSHNKKAFASAAALPTGLMNEGCLRSGMDGNKVKRTYRTVYVNGAYG